MAVDDFRSQKPVPIHAVDRTYLSESLRLRARELATKELGPRTELEFGASLIVRCPSSD